MKLYFYCIFLTEYPLLFMITSGSSVLYALDVCARADCEYTVIGNNKTTDALK